MRPLYWAWLEFTLWFSALVIGLWITKGLTNWWQPLVMWLILVLCFVVTKCFGYPGEALPLVGFLVFIGWIFLARLDQKWAEQQFWGFLIGMLAYCIALFGNFLSFDTPRLFAGGSLALLILTLLFGQRIGGAQAWLTVAGLRFQPVEISRIFLVLYLGRELSGKPLNWKNILVLGIFCCLLVLQRDLGPALLIFLVFCSLSLYTHFSWYTLFGYLGTIILGFFVAYLWFPHFTSRVLAWVWPWNYPDSKGYQILQGLFALNAGGFVGTGFGSGVVGVIPANHTDYLFAVIGEEFGLIGTFSLLLVYLALAFWAIQLLTQVEDTARRTMGLGLTLLLHGQVFLVVGGILRLLPFTGMTLPFVSYGSTSLVAQFFMLGLITSLGGAPDEEKAS